MKSFAALALVTVFLSAFLLFQVQPVISRAILPWFGGGPAVWTTCALFFQAVLLAGYGYAHFLGRLGPGRKAFFIHSILLVLAAATLPILPSEGWKPVDSAAPSGRILLILGASVGLPYFMLSSSGPLISAWFGAIFPQKSAWRLYALSNAGSLLALGTYPFLIEPRLDSRAQSLVWSVGFGLFALLAASLARAVWRLKKAEKAAFSAQNDSKKLEKADAPTSIFRRLAWLGLPMLATVALLAVTAHLCQDVAVVPFFWAVPLGLYLVSFIVTFDAAGWYRRRVFAGLLAAFSVLIAVNLGADGLNETLERLAKDFFVFEKSPFPKLDGHFFSAATALANGFFEKIGIEKRLEIGQLAGESLAFLAWLFLVCTAAHGEAVRLRPSADRLTEFYLFLSAGGAMGGLFVSLVCPTIFDFQAEMLIVLTVGAALAAIVFWQERIQSSRFWVKKGLFGLLAGLVVFIGWASWLAAFSEKSDFKSRNFYGTITVRDRDNGRGDRLRELLDGRIVHGSQWQDSTRRLRPTSYYERQTGAGHAIRFFQKGSRPARVGVIGLGAGTLAAYGKTGDFFAFYELNPAVAAVAEAHFSFLKSSKAATRIALGDARLTLEREKAQAFDLLLLDAFSGDAIPAHLLTREAFEVYFRHLADAEKGAIAVHISNRHLDLRPVLFEICLERGFRAVIIERRVPSNFGPTTSDWAILTRNSELLDDAGICENGQYLEPPVRRVRAWTDGFSNLFEILK